MYKSILDNMDNFLQSGAAIDINYRINALKKLKASIKKYEDEILLSLYRDLGKNAFEAYETEIGLCYTEINNFIKNIKKWSKPKNVHTNIINFGAKSVVKPCAYGKVLIISPWNYPFQLAIMPLIGAIGAGNCVFLKLSEYSINTSKVIIKILKDAFDEDYVFGVYLEKEETQKLLKENFEYIFFTGSPKIGKKIMESASKNLTPVTLELGGKSPCIIFEDCDLDLAAKRTVFGKFLNAGQTCVAPDYCLVQKNIKDEFLKNLIKYIKIFYGENQLQSNNLGKIINQLHFERLKNHLEKSQIIFGGNTDEKSLKIQPSIIKNNIDEEIFGPILPLIEFDSIENIKNYINKYPTPLSIYIFTKNNDIIEKLTSEISFGGGCINDTIMHLTNENLPFGGVGNSGMGSYHGKKSFDTFSHFKSILIRKNNFDIDMRYPNNSQKLETIKKIMK
mgnify:CR=1 FL=1